MVLSKPKEEEFQEGEVIKSIKYQKGINNIENKHCLLV